jgi:hypothetical protein
MVLSVTNDLTSGNLAARARSYDRVTTLVLGQDEGVATPDARPREPVAGPLDALAAHFPDAVPVADFVTWTDWALAGFGFRPVNVLALVDVCRDELMLGFQHAVRATWGPTFDAGSLAALPLLGRTGIGAALSHAPGEDGRHRFVVFAFPHIGIDDAGVVGSVRRPGIRHGTTACGALVAARAQLATEPLGRLAFDDDDVEMSLLRRVLRAELGEAPMPDLVTLTEVVRRRVTSELERLVAGLTEVGSPVDHAMLSGVVVHAPDGSDLVALAAAYVVIDGCRRDLARD